MADSDPEPPADASVAGIAESSLEDTRPGTATESTPEEDDTDDDTGNVNDAEEGIRESCRGPDPNTPEAEPPEAGTDTALPSPEAADDTSDDEEFARL